MTHMIQGLIALPGAAAMAAATGVATAASLDVASLVFIPMTDALLEYLEARFRPRTNEPHRLFDKLSTPAALWLCELSMAGRVAYVETEYFGGDGVQSAAVWERGAIAFGPKQADVGPINEALRLLGVERTSAKDEFDTVGLDRHRGNKGWIEEASQ